MNCSTTFSMKMESKEMATKALEIMKSVLAQTDVDGFEYDSRETFDRFADNLVVKGSEIIDMRLEIVGSITIDCRKGDIDPMSQAFIQMSAVFAELELSIIRARVKSGMANAKEKGKHVGRPQTTKDDMDLRPFVELYSSLHLPYLGVLKGRGRWLLRVQINLLHVINTVTTIHLSKKVVFNATGDAFLSTFIHSMGSNKILVSIMAHGCIVFCTCHQFKIFIICQCVILGILGISKEVFDFFQSPKLIKLNNNLHRKSFLLSFRELVHM